MVAPFLILVLHLEQLDENLALICRGSFEYFDIVLYHCPVDFYWHLARRLDFVIIFDSCCFVRLRIFKFIVDAAALKAF